MSPDILKKKLMEINCIKQESLKSFLTYLIVGTCLIISHICFAKTITIKGTQVINHHLSYNHITINLDGNMVINKSGLLDIQNSTINFVISPATPYFVRLNGGNLNLINNTFNVIVQNITPNPSKQPAFFLIRIVQGQVNLMTNQFNIDTHFTVGLLSTDKNFTTDGFNISNNRINQFHMGLLLINSSNAIISKNTFNKVSFSNIYNIGGTNTKILNNVFTFPGNFKPGDAIDVVNAINLNISDNKIFSSSSYGITVRGTQNLLIDSNNIMDGLSYAIYFIKPLMMNLKKDHYLWQMYDSQHQIKQNENIVISNNNILKNRFGIAGDTIISLTVANNFFVQAFLDNAARKFWTNNDNLLKNIPNFLWEENIYKESFSQDNAGDNSKSMKVVTFPAHGGVVIEN